MAGELLLTVLRNLAFRLRAKYEYICRHRRCFGYWCMRERCSQSFRRKLTHFHRALSRRVARNTMFPSTPCSECWLCSTNLQMILKNTSTRTMREFGCARTSTGKCFDKTTVLFWEMLGTDFARMLNKLCGLGTVTCVVNVLKAGNSSAIFETSAIIKLPVVAIRHRMSWHKNFLPRQSVSFIWITSLKSQNKETPAQWLLWFMLDMPERAAILVCGEDHTHGAHNYVWEEIQKKFQLAQVLAMRLHISILGFTLQGATTGFFVDKPDIYIAHLTMVKSQVICSCAIPGWQVSRFWRVRKTLSVKLVLDWTALEFCRNVWSDSFHVSNGDWMGALDPFTWRSQEVRENTLQKFSTSQRNSLSRACMSEELFLLRTKANFHGRWFRPFLWLIIYKFAALSPSNQIVPARTLWGRSVSFLFLSSWVATISVTLCASVERILEL